MALGSGRKGRKTADEERKMMKLLGKSFDFLNNNFEHFDEKTKIHIALELVKRRVPQPIEHRADDVLETLAERLKEARSRVAQYNNPSSN